MIRNPLNFLKSEILTMKSCAARRRIFSINGRPCNLKILDFFYNIVYSNNNQEIDMRRKTGDRDE